jgi:hypothetical protein
MPISRLVSSNKFKSDNVDARVSARAALFDKTALYVRMLLIVIFWNYVRVWFLPLSVPILVGPVADRMEKNGSEISW